VIPNEVPAVGLHCPTVPRAHTQNGATGILGCFQEKLPSCVVERRGRWAVRYEDVVCVSLAVFFCGKGTDDRLSKLAIELVPEIRNRIVCLHQTSFATLFFESEQRLVLPRIQAFGDNRS